MHRRVSRANRIREKTATKLTNEWESVKLRRRRGGRKRMRRRQKPVNAAFSMFRNREKIQKERGRDGRITE